MHSDLDWRQQTLLDAVYSYDQKLEAFHIWQQLSRVNDQERLRRFFENNTVAMRPFLSALSSGWRPDQPDTLPEAYLLDETKRRVVERFGELTIVDNAVHPIPGNRFLVIVSARNGTMNQAFVRSRTVNTAHATAWRPVDALSTLYPALPVCIVEPVTGMFVRDFDELLMSWWLGGKFWSENPYPSVGIAGNDTEPDAVKAIGKNTKQFSGQLAELTIPQVNDLISNNRANVVQAPLSERQRHLVDRLAIARFYADIDYDDPDFHSEQWTIEHAVWLELATFFHRRFITGKPPGSAFRKVLIGESTNLDRALALLQRFRGLFVSVDEPLRYKLTTVVDSATGGVIEYDLVYIVIAWHGNATLLNDAVQKLGDDAVDFTTRYPQPWTIFTTQPLDLFKTWVDEMWLSSRADVPGTELSTKPYPLYYWQRTDDRFSGARRGREVRPPSPVERGYAEFARTVHAVFRPQVAPVPFTFLYYANDNNALHYLEPEALRRRRLKRLLEEASNRVSASSVMRLKLRNLTPWDSLAELASRYADPDKQHAFKHDILSKLALATTKNDFINDQEAPAPLYQRVFYVWRGEEALSLLDKSMRGIAE
jgi:hypothetical protein